MRGGVQEKVSLKVYCSFDLPASPAEHALSHPVIHSQVQSATINVRFVDRVYIRSGDIPVFVKIYFNRISIVAFTRYYGYGAPESGLYLCLIFMT
jgi:hypothetical protein